MANQSVLVSPNNYIFQNQPVHAAIAEDGNLYLSAKDVNRIFNAKRKTKPLKKNHDKLTLCIIRPLDNQESNDLYIQELPLGE